MIALINLFITFFYLIASMDVGNKIPESISETSYIWEKYCKESSQFHIAYIFSIYCFVTAILLFIPWLEATPDRWQFTCFLGCSGITMAGITPFFKKYGIDRYIHYVGGIIALISYVVWMIATHYCINLCLSVIIFITCSIINRKKFVLWAEIISLISLLIILMYL